MIQAYLTRAAASKGLAGRARRIGEETIRFANRLLAVFFLLAFSAWQALAEVKDDVTAAYQAWDAAFNASDAKVVSAFYADNSMFLPAIHDVIEGPAGVEKFFAGLFEMGVTGQSLS